MAKKPTVNPNMFAKTEPAGQQPPAPEEKPQKIPLGVQLTLDEIAALDEIKVELGFHNRHNLMQMIIRYFIEQYRSGKIKTETQTIKKIVS